MGQAIEVISASATQPNTGAAAAPLTGDSLTIKNAKNPKILAVWADVQVAGWVQIVRPSGHDTTRDVRFRTSISEVDVRSPMGIPIGVEPQELLGVTIAGSNVAGDVESMCMLMHYDDLPGSQQRLITDAELTRRIDKLLTIEASITVTTGPAYSGAELITAESALLKANRDYAVIGANIGVECNCICLRGPDTANLRIPIPGNDLDNALTAQWFPFLSRAFGLPLIPVFNSGNAASTYIEGSSDENATAVPVSLILALLK